MFEEMGKACGYARDIRRKFDYMVEAKCWDQEQNGNERWVQYESKKFW